MNLDKLITSSASPDKMSATVKGVLTSLLPIIMIFTGASEADATNLVNQITLLVFYGSSLYSVGMTLFGIGRKFYHGRWSALDE